MTTYTHRPNSFFFIQFFIKILMGFSIMLTISCALLGCSETRSSSTAQNNPRDAKNSAQIGFSFSQFNASKFNPEGALINTLTGQSLTHYPEQKKYLIKQPQGITQSNQIWHINAHSAQANEQLDTIHWQDNVILTNTQTPPETLKTQSLIHHPTNGQLSSDRDVTFESNLGTIQAQGFNLNTQTENLNLLGDVRAHYDNKPN